MKSVEATMQRSMAACLFAMVTAASAPATAGESVAGTYDAAHPHWRDTVVIKEDGTYRRGNGDPGRWTLEGKLLVLGWANWRPELLEAKGPGKYVAKNGFTLVKREERSRHDRREDRRHDRREDRRDAKLDCGTGDDDPGCVKRGGRSPMDAGQFAGMMTALKATSNELVKKDMALTMLESSPITARQFGQVIAMFGNELTRMEVVRERAGQLVDPKNALGFASTFNNSLIAQEYVQVISSVKAD
jgi:hypothetical protein